MSDRRLVVRLVRRWNSPATRRTRLARVVVARMKDSVDHMTDAVSGTPMLALCRNEADGAISELKTDGHKEN